MLKEQVCRSFIHWGSDIRKKIVSFVFTCPQITEFASPTSFICLTNTFYMPPMCQALLQTLELIVGRDWQKHINIQTSISDDCVREKNSREGDKRRKGYDMVKEGLTRRWHLGKDLKEMRQGYIGFGVGKVGLVCWQHPRPTVQEMQGPR